MQRHWRFFTLLGLGMFSAILGPELTTSNVHAQSNKSFSSKTLTKQTPGNAVDIEIDVRGAKMLYLVVTDAGNGFSCDWADWVEPRFIGPEGEKKLTELKWKSATTGWRDVRINKNAAGGPLKVDGKSVKYGIGTHANSVITYNIPKGFDSFKVRGGLDDGGVTQQNGAATSVKFHVFLDKLPKFAKQKATNKSQSQGGNLPPTDSLEALAVADGVEATLFAAEPMLLSPTNIDVDAKGRIWVCECVNYRGRNGTRKEGDRILILEDTDGDGKADSKKVYYQGRDVDSAMGICVLGNKLIVSCAPNVFIFTDEDGDDRPDRKEVLFTKTGQPQHDHSAHAFLFGPDGKLYWNVGNTGRHVHDKNGKIVVDLAGNKVIDNGNPYYGGMVFRCDMDGSNFEVLGHNFRNNYEVTVDSFGTIWQSDNDDDGNRGVRINYVMEYGNYGYRDEKTGAGWRSPRTGMHSEIPKRHWHLNDPGVVPNLLQTGQGSPTGICVYEGDLLPKVFRQQVIHCDAGPNITRAYPAKKDGAGFSAEIVDVLGPGDRWYRPSDVCVAPDGSLIIADWYDPGVGGHRMGDIDKGRIFRIAPAGAKYKMPKFDFNTVEGCIKALKNPCLSVRYVAWTELHNRQEKAEASLLQMFGKDEPALYRARALWLLGKIKGKGAHYVEKALSDSDADIRIVGVRLARQLGMNVIPLVTQLVKDESPQVRRECLIALRHNKSEKMPELWTQLATQHDGKDRWYLEALGISADKQWDRCLQTWLDEVGKNWNTPAGRDIIWRSRAEVTPSYLAKIIADADISREDLPRYFRAFDFLSGSEKDEALLALAFQPVPGAKDRQSFAMAEALARLQKVNLNSKQVKTAINKILDENKGSPEFIKLVDRFNVKDRYPDLLALAQKNPDQQIGVDAIKALLNKKQFAMIRKAILSKDAKAALATIKVLGVAQDTKAVNLLSPFVKDAKKPLDLRREAVRSMSTVRPGALELVSLAKSKNVDPLLKDSLAAALHQAQWRDVKEQAVKLFPLPAGKNNVKLPSIAELLSKKGDAKRGKLIFEKQGTCANCHIVNKAGKEVGPDLSEIGDKLSRQAMFEAVLFPSAAISHNYESYIVELKSGNFVTGLLVSKTPTEVVIKGADSILRKHPPKDIVEILKQPISLMPADLTKNLTAQDMVDVVEYLNTLKKKSAKTSWRDPEGDRPFPGVESHSVRVVMRRLDLIDRRLEEWNRW